MSTTAQTSGSAVLSGTVTDSTGAVIRNASAHLSRAGENGEGRLDTKTDEYGTFTFSVPAGSYVVTVEAPGFADYTSRVITLQSSGKLRFPVHLQVASLTQEINVLDDEASGSDVAGALVFEGDRLSQLSDDNATLQQQLNALAGGLGTAHFLIDGFSGGRLPPKSSIRSIRVNRNPFSAAFPDLGFGRVEISTNPGTDQFHGQFELGGTDQPLNARDPYAGVLLPFYDFQQDGSLSGPIGKKTSFFASELTEDLANTVAVNAADPAAPATLLSSAAAAPQLTQTYSLRLDREVSRTNFAYLRDEWNQTHIQNSGIVPLVLPEAAFTSNVLTNALQLSDTQVLGAHALNEVRFQYLRTRASQDPNSFAPSVVVQGSFQSGGNPNQVLRGNQDSYELQDLFEVEHKTHAIRAGFRFRRVRDANESSAGFSGQYIFPDVASYLAAQPTQYSQTLGQQGAVLSVTDTSVYGEDDWKLTKNFTLSYGLRLESQSAVPDHFDPAPRVGFSWAIRPGKRTTPILTLKGGYGIFYDRFPEPQLLQAIRQNGVRQIAFVANNPDFNPDGPPSGAVLSASQPTTYTVSPSLHTAYSQIASLGVTRSMARFGTVSANLQYGHDSHNYLTRNINAPLPGTFDPTIPDSGIRPLGTLQNIYQFSSVANGNLERFFVNYQLQVTHKISAFGVFAADKNYTESDGIGQFPSNEYNLRQDYARATIDHAQNYTGGFQVALPYGVQVMPFLSARSGTPFDITTGTDLNGDTIYNDRPALATNPGTAAVVKTAFGAFDVAPGVAQPVLARNYGTAPAYVWVMLRAGKDIHLGPRPRASVAGPDGKPGPVPERPWNLNFGVEVHNLTNHNNPGIPVGAIAATPATGPGSAAGSASGTNCTLVPSPYFGHSLSLAPDFSPITASNRTILLQTSFTW